MTNALRAVLRAGSRIATAPLDRSAVRALARARHPDALRIANVIRALREPLPPAERDALAAIERIRAELLARRDALVDGSLDRRGLYDGDGTVGDAAAVSKAAVPLQLLYRLVRAFAPRSVVELGTNLGISSAYLATALQANGGGRIATIDASPYRLRIARDVHARLGLAGVEYTNGLFSDTLPAVLARAGAVDFVFIDGHHQYDPTLAYFNTIWTHAAPGALFIFDDIRWSKGMRKAWAKLQEDERLALTVDLGYTAVAIGRRPGETGSYRSRRMFFAAR